MPQPRTIATAALLLTILLASACQGAAAQAAPTVTISGAFALYPMVIQWAEAYRVTHPDVQFDISAGGAGKGMSDVLDGAVDIAMVSREVRPEESEQGAVAIAVAKDAVVATVSADNPYLETLLATGLTPRQAADLWLTGEVTTWGELLGGDVSDEVHVFTRADACGAAEVWALFLGGTAQEDLQGIAVQGDPGLAEAVRQDALGIGYNNLNFAYDPATKQPVSGLSVVPIDLNADGQISSDEDFYASKDSLTSAIAEGRYPSPPARALYLVTRGQPTGPSAEFIRWVLTEGQAYVEETGYVRLTDAQLQASLELLAE